MALEFVEAVVEFEVWCLRLAKLRQLFGSYRVQGSLVSQVQRLQRGLFEVTSLLSVALIQPLLGHVLVVVVVVGGGGGGLV